MTKVAEGIIPAGTKCPFEGQCEWKTVKNCQVCDGRTLPRDFTCVAARAYNTLKERESSKDASN